MCTRILLGPEPQVVASACCAGRRKRTQGQRFNGSAGAKRKASAQSKHVGHAQSTMTAALGRKQPLELGNLQTLVAAACLVALFRALPLKLACADDGCGVGTHALADWRLKPAP